MEQTAESLLEQAFAIYQQGKLDYRDARIAVGHKLHEFVIAYLIEKKNRVTMPFRPGFCRPRTCRAEAILVATERLDCKLTQETSRLIVIAKIVELLADDGNIGQLGVVSLFQFYRFIQRKGVSRNFHQNKIKNKGKPEDANTWFIKPEYAEVAKQLFRSAVAENWNTARAMAEVTSVYGESVKSRFGRAGQILPETREKVEQLAVTLQKASSDTIADVCTQMVEASDDPQAVVAKVANKVARKVTGLRGKHRPDEEEDNEHLTMEGVLGSLAKAAPGDVSDQCLKIVLASEDPWQVAQRLIADLQKIPRKKPNPLLFERAS
jgi:hypothetical protein